MITLVNSDSDRLSKIKEVAQGIEAMLVQPGIVVQPRLGIDPLSPLTAQRLKRRLESRGIRFNIEPSAVGWSASLFAQSGELLAESFDRNRSMAICSASAKLQNA